ncbi:exo-alpha-sialidase [Actinoallomurus purpureus]|uniref:sialidase family protein n=1 Tax=Actinoallomurus purpureus TaxID=478114 RepID=UPI002093BF93|nr:sialidase family protein [Actinoallomurus purpureus]MCO6010375.1 exo-alpha-sialidase [Actinoallomurus purpureus]
MRYASEKPPSRRPAAWRRVALIAAGLLLGSPAALAAAHTAGATTPVSARTGGVTAPPPSAKPTSAAPFVDEQVLFQQKQFGYACFRIPAVVRAADGMVLAFAEGRVKDCGDDEDIDLVLRRSADGGRTWGPLQVVSEGNGSTHGNPVPIVDRRTGRIVLVSTHNGPAPCPNGCDRDPYVQSSDDDGATWTAPREMTEGKRPEWNFWYATGPMHGIQLTRGRHAGRLVLGASYEIYDGGTGPHVYGTHLLYSDDSGVTWHIGATSAFDDGSIIAQEVTVVELTDGRIYALARERGTDPGHRAYAISKDGGETFERPFRTVKNLALPDVQASTLRLHARDQGDRTNRILLSSPAHPVAREAMAVFSSFDEARTWQPWQRGKVFWWGPSAYSDMVKLGNDEIGLYYEAGTATPYETIRWARFNEAYLATPNGTPPGIPGPPAPGPKTPDASPHHNDAYVRGDAQSTTGRFGQGLALDGVDDRVEVPYSRAIDVGGGDFTMTTSFRYSDTAGAHALLWAYRWGSGTTPQLWLRAEPASHRILAMIAVDRFNISVQSASAYNDDRWHHVALQRADGRFSLWIDGTQVASAAVPPGSVTEGKEFGVDGIHVGERLDGANRFHGTLDDLRVYKRALSPAEIQTLATSDQRIGGRLALWLPFETVS